MQGQWVKVGSDVNLGTILDRQIDNKLKREGYGPVAGRRTFGIPSLEQASKLWLSNGIPAWALPRDRAKINI